MDNIVKELVEDLRVPFQADGGDFEIVEITEDLVKCRIVIRPSTCRECILDAESVQEIMTSMLEDRLGRTVRVEVEVDEQS